MSFSIKLDHKYSYDSLAPDMKAYADKRIKAHRAAWEDPDNGLGKPLAVWWDSDKNFCAEYMTPDGFKHWFHYKFTGGSHQFDGFEWW